MPHGLRSVRNVLFLTCSFFSFGLGVLQAEDKPTEPAAEAKPAISAGVEALTEQTRKAVVVVTVMGRDGRQQGLGSGFVISPDGLIATNLHVIGEARPVSVQTADGKRWEVKAIEAVDRQQDLALIRVDAKDLPILSLGDSDKLRQGQGVVALGNPQGLKHSVVTGVVSGTREIDGRQMIQLAIPIEPGNSGGPLVDMQGNVHGILTMKSAVTENLGFAVPINALKPLMARPNPIPIARWLTIGALDPQEWKPLFGSRWRQRAGRILVDGVGQGFGGRSLCLSEQPTPEPPYEIAVSVKLDHEEGAAGIVFCSDGADVHYGFYPSNGKLRLSRFDGPDVFSWQVLNEVSTPHYRSGDWNTIKVRFEKGKIQGFLNGHVVVESSDDRLSSGKFGLGKFRTTEAEFRRFRIGKDLDDGRISDEVQSRVHRLMEKSDAGASLAALTEQLAVDGSASVALLRDSAKQMEQRAAEIRRLAQSVHEHQVRQELVKLLEQEDASVDLFHAGLLVALLDNDEVDVASYRRELDRIVRDIVATVPEQASEAEKLAALNKYLFDDQGFHGSRGDYYHRSNSYVNEVLDDREGLPITLSLIYIEIARRIDLKVVGVGLPGHFVVRFEPKEGAAQLIDVYERAAALSTADAEKIIRGATARAPQESDFAPATRRSMIIRILHNLLGLAQRSQDTEAMLRYLDVLIAVAPQNADERWMRAVMLYRAGRREAALADVHWLLENRPEGVNLNQVDELRRVLERP